jgi:hypothetical protein
LKYVKTMVIILIVVACVFLANRFITFGPPSPSVIMEDMDVPTIQGSYCWSGFINSKCVDMIAPPELLASKELKPIQVPPQSSIKIQFKKQPKPGSLGANLWTQGTPKTVKVKGNEFTAPKEPGVYVYDIFAAWENGSSSYAFTIEVK